MTRETIDLHADPTLLEGPDHIVGEQGKATSIEFVVDAANSFLESGRGKLSIACTHPDIGNDEITIGPLRDGRMLVEIAVPANAMLGDFDLVAGIYDWARATGGRGPSLEWQTRLEIVQEIRAWSPQRWLNELEPGLRTWIEIIGGALGIAVAAATFYFLLWPRPDACVRQLVGQLGPPIVDRGVTYGEYLKRIGEPPGNADPKTLKRVGNILDFRITVVGYRGKRLPVRWSTLTEGGRPLNAPSSLISWPSRSSPTTAVTAVAV